GDSINVEPTPSGYRNIAHLAQQQATSHADLAQRLAPIIEATAHLDDPGTTPTQGPDLAAAVLVGISAAITPDELEGLVSTAAELILLVDCGEGTPNEPIRHAATVHLADPHQAAGRALRPDLGRGPAQPAAPRRAAAAASDRGGHRPPPEAGQPAHHLRRRHP